MIDAQINGIKCKLAYDERLTSEKAPIGYPFVYYIRHDENKWTKPIMLEKFVFVNFFGTVFMSKPIEFNNENYVDIKRFRMEGQYVVFNASTSYINRVLKPSNE